MNGYYEAKRFVESMWPDMPGQKRRYILRPCQKLPVVIDKLGRKSALFCYGIEELEVDRWLPVDYASYDLEWVKLVKRALVEKTGRDGFRIVRFEKNIEVEE